MNLGPNSCETPLADSEGRDRAAGVDDLIQRVKKGILDALRKWRAAYEQLTLEIEEDERALDQKRLELERLEEEIKAPVCQVDLSRTPILRELLGLAEREVP